MAAAPTQKRWHCKANGWYVALQIKAPQQGTRGMKRFSFAIVATAGLMLASCGGSNEDATNDVDVNAAQSGELNDLSMEAANDAANSVEMETLGNQANQLEQEAPENTAAPVDDADAEAMNVSGM